jgi:acetylornithine deacetylase/succinyl-diaminopimelate desuccinylase-like protein
LQRARRWSTMGAVHVQTPELVELLRALIRNGCVSSGMPSTGEAGDVVFWAAPDEECGGRQGVVPVLERWPDLVRTDVALTEVGGAVIGSPEAPLVEAYTADKGTSGLLITVRGTQGHSSIPYGVRNPVVVAAEVVRRLDAWEPTVRISEPWRRYVLERHEPGPLRDALLDAATLDEALGALDPHEARHAHACTRCTVVPTIVSGGDKVNTIPASVSIAVNIRTTWDDDITTVVEELRALLADLVDPSDVRCPAAIAPTSSPVGTSLWSVLREVTSELLGGARLLPSVLPAQTDARWLRPVGTEVYGFGLLNPAISAEDYWARFHGVDERIDVTSLSLMLQGYDAVVRRFSVAG